MKYYSIIYSVIIFILIPICLNSQTYPTIQKVPACNIANILLDNNNFRDIRNIMDYYGWMPEDCDLTWKNKTGEEIIIKISDDGNEIERVELLTDDIGQLDERLRTLQYQPVSYNGAESVPGHTGIPKEIYSCKRKRVALFSQGSKTTIVFFRSNKQGYTRFGPEQN